MEQDQTRDNKPERDEKGQLLPGNTANPNGRPKETEEQKVIKKATKEFIKDYKEKLAEALPQISPVLIAAAISGDIKAIKEVNDRVMGKPEQKFEGDIKINPIPILEIKKDSKDICQKESSKEQNNINNIAEQ